MPSRRVIIWLEAMGLGVSREQFHRLIDDLPSDKLPSLADLIRVLIEEDDEPVSDKEVSHYLKVRKDMLAGKYVDFENVFPER